MTGIIWIYGYTINVDMLKNRKIAHME